MTRIKFPSLFLSMRRRARIHHVYYLLAAFDLAAVVAGLFLTHYVNGVLSNTVQGNLAWSAFHGQVAHVRSAAGLVNAPGNDVFESKDPAQEQKRFDEAVAAFWPRLQQLRQDVAQRVPDDAINPSHALDALEASMQIMVRQTLTVLGHYAEGDAGAAGGEMAAMDRSYSDVLKQIETFAQVARRIETAMGMAALEGTRNLQVLERLLGLIVFTMVIAVTIYGHKLGKLFQRQYNELISSSAKLMDQEQKLAAQNVQFDTALNNMIQGLTMFDADRRLVLFNDRFASMYKLSREHLKLGMSLPELLDLREAAGTAFPKHRDVFFEAVNKLSEHVTSSKFTTELSDGRCIAVALQRMACGGSVATHEDVTELRHYDELKLAHATSLEAEERAGRAVVEAEAANAARSLFFAVVSHEIRTPLNGVLGALDLIRGDKLTERVRKHVGMATESGEYLLALIDDILLVSKVEDPEFKLTAAPFGFGDLLRSVHLSMLPLAAKGGNEICLDLPVALNRHVVGDRNRLRQVLVNLIGNAAKFTHGGTIILRAELLAHSGDGMVIGVMVMDTGIGIPKDKQGLVFDRFQSLDASYSRRTDGTGLGLAICNKIVQAMGGVITLTSDVGRGSVFSFELTVPVAGETSGDKDIVIRSRNGCKVDRPLRILLAEDNPTNAYIVHEYLSDAGHDVQHAKNGREVLDLASDQPFDIIFMDISMPVLDGIQATDAIRSSGSCNARTPIIALTAHVGEDQRERFIAAGMNGYLSKPIGRRELLDALLDVEKAVPAIQDARPSDDDLRPVIDVAVLGAFARDRPSERLEEVLLIFTTELRAKKDSLDRTIANHDVAALGRQAHAVAGSASMVGCARLVAISRAIEADCRNGNAIDWAHAVSMQEVLDETIAAFEPLNTAEAVAAKLTEAA